MAAISATFSRVQVARPATSVRAVAPASASMEPPVAMTRDEEVTARLEHLIDILQEEYGVDFPPEDAASTWTERQVRDYFLHGGLLPTTTSVEEDSSIPGGTRPQALPEPQPPGVAETIRAAFTTSTVEEYRAVAKPAGIPSRPHGLFPQGDPMLVELAQRPGMVPFQKHLLGADGKQALAQAGWVSGDAAAQHGLDLRLFYCTEREEVEGVVRFGDGAAIGVGFWTTAHGGSIESVLDEATAEVAKCFYAPTATTSTIEFKIHAPVPLHTTLRVAAQVVELATQGLRINTRGTIEGADGTLYCSCSAQLVDMGKFYTMR